LRCYRDVACVCFRLLHFHNSFCFIKLKYDLTFKLK